MHCGWQAWRRRGLNRYNYSAFASGIRMKRTSSGFQHQVKIPAEFAFCAPAGTLSFALICHDYDVPGNDFGYDGP